VAVFDVHPQGLSRNVKYGSSFSDGKSRGATGGLNSSEAWFIYLTFWYKGLERVVTFCAERRISYVFCTSLSSVFRPSFSKGTHLQAPVIQTKE
jgi:hypothetical protein